LFIHHPMVEYYLKAVRCCLLECEGFQSGFGHALTQTSNGFIGLEDIKV
jgi:lipopolysaccharide transport system ATP-binding protein